MEEEHWWSRSDEPNCYGWYGLLQGIRFIQLESQ
jgi:hypothetical protein